MYVIVISCKREPSINNFGLGLITASCPIFQEEWSVVYFVNCDKMSHKNKVKDRLEGNIKYYQKCSDGSNRSTD